MRSILQHPVYSDKLKELYIAWLARYGSGWVEVRYDQNLDNYFKYVADVLIRVGKLQMTTRHNPESWNSSYWYKLVKDE